MSDATEALNLEIAQLDFAEHQAGESHFSRAE